MLKTLAVVAAAVLLYFGLNSAWDAYGLFSAIDRKQNMLLHHTNHTAIQAECKSLMQGVKKNANDLELYRSNPRIPSEIASLDPTYVVVRYGVVKVEFGGGFFHYGFIAMFDKDADLPESREDCRILMPGFYYYAEDGHMRH